jgi:hypothetical protein
MGTFLSHHAPRVNFSRYQQRALFVAAIARHNRSFGMHAIL